MSQPASCSFTARRSWVHPFCVRSLRTCGPTTFNSEGFCLMPATVTIARAGQCCLYWSKKVQRNKKETCNLCRGGVKKNRGSEKVCGIPNQDHEDSARNIGFSSTRIFCVDDRTVLRGLRTSRRRYGATPKKQ